MAAGLAGPRARRSRSQDTIPAAMPIRFLVRLGALGAVLVAANVSAAPPGGGKIRVQADPAALSAARGYLTPDLKAKLNAAKLGGARACQARS